MSEECKDQNEARECDSSECQIRGTKRSIDVEQVHSANEWERADLGDDGRKSKFLRLMGASKTQHQGRFVIGDKKPAGATTAHGRTEDDVKKLETELEGQYRQGLDLKMSGGSRRHTGLGFQPANVEDKNGKGAAVDSEEATSTENILVTGDEETDSRDYDTVVPAPCESSFDQIPLPVDEKKLEDKPCGDCDDNVEPDGKSTVAGFVCDG